MFCLADINLFCKPRNSFLGSGGKATKIHKIIWKTGVMERFPNKVADQQTGIF